MTLERLPTPHPGDLLREELETLGKTAYWLAKNLGVPQMAVSEILRGKRGISAAMALRLGRFFGNSAEFWLNLQAFHDLREEERRMGEQLRRIEPLSGRAA